MASLLYLHDFVLYFLPFQASFKIFFFAVNFLEDFPVITFLGFQSSVHLLLYSAVPGCVNFLLCYEQFQIECYLLPKDPFQIGLLLFFVHSG